MKKSIFGNITNTYRIKKRIINLNLLLIHQKNIILLLSNRYMFYLLLSLISFSQICIAQGGYFEHLKITDGLSHYSVNSLYQDEHGLIWIGTRDGLNRYDGNKITVFKQIKGDSTALFGNNIRSVCGDKNGHLFVRCKSGLLAFDLKKEIFKTIRKKDVSTISYGKENLWFCSSDSIFSYHPNSEIKLKFHFRFSENGVRASALLETTDRLLYVATSSNGLIVFDKNKKVVKRWDITGIVNLYEDSKRNIWVCTRNNGLFKIDFTGSIVGYQHNPSNAESIPDNFVRTICEDNFGNYWIGLYNGLCKLSAEKEIFSLYKYDKQNSNGLSNSSVWTIINDSQGTIWIGTYFGGIDLFNPKYSIFNYFGAFNNSTNSLSSPIVGRIVEENSGNLWIGTDGGGINYYDRKNQSFKSYLAANTKNNISTNTVKSLWLDEKRSNLWIGTHLGGLNKLNLKSKQFSVFQYNSSNPQSIPNNDVREIIHRNDTLYLATQSSIGVFDLKTETCSTMKFWNLDLTNKELPDIFIDSKKRMWFGYSNQVYSYDLTTHKLTKHESDNNILIFFEDSKNRLWAGTDGDGIYLLNEKTQRLEPNAKFNSHLLSKYIIDFKESKGGYFYVSTNAGLVIVDTELQHSQTLNSKMGFPLEALNENSILITNKNEVFVGGINGMVSFQEKDLNIPRADYSVNITDIRVNNKNIIPGESSIIKQSFPYLNEIVLKPEHSVITILFSTTNYINVLKTDVQYQLVGFDKDWIDANFQQSITYTNLNSGKYTLKIRGKNQTSAGIFPEREISITVLPPFYKTTLAYFIYLILISIISFLLIRFYKSKIQLSTSLEYEKREKTHIEELNQSKLRFFTNISHEFRTPLTLIISQIEVLLQLGNIPQTIYSRLLNVMRNANLMKKLISELIDFRKYEQGFMELKVTENELIPYLNGIFVSFKELAQSKQIVYTFEYKQPDLKLWFDENQMEKVFYNLLANAFKFTPSSGNITLQVEEIDFSVVITIIDTGVGIDKKSLNQIFDRFYQAENSSLDWTNRQGSGIGLALAKGIINLHSGEIKVESEPNVGSKFRVKLMQGNNHFVAEQIISPQNKDLECITEITTPDKEFIEHIIDSQKAVNALNSSILIIEDNDELLQLLASIFQPIYKVITATDGLEGLEKASELQPDIILSDVMMPRMSGVEMCSKLKLNFETSHIPIVLLTAQTAADFIVQGLLTGADDYIIKPFNLKVLVTRCNNLVNTRKLLQRKFALQTDFEPQMIATNSIDQQLLEKATAIVEKNMDNPDFDINAFASEMWLSRTNLFNKLKGVTGQTPNDFIVNMRLKKSIYYLVNFIDLPIADVAVRVSFGSTSYYIKKFHKLYGVTPSQYRKNLNQNTGFQNFTGS
jgi:signal transduction histidine kinase/ligand-binding sensor domain-containing protein/DNA-binding response OmpR family regulator